MDQTKEVRGRATSVSELGRKGVRPLDSLGRSFVRALAINSFMSQFMTSVAGHRRRLLAHRAATPGRYGAQSGAGFGSVQFHLFLPPLLRELRSSLAFRTSLAL